MRRLPLLLLALLLAITSPAAAQVIADDRPLENPDAGQVYRTLDAANEIAKIKMAGYQRATVTFSTNTSFLGTVKPVCSFTGNADADFISSADYKFIQRSDGASPGASASLVDANVTGSFTVWCGDELPRYVGVKVTAYTSGSVRIQGWSGVGQIAQTLRAPSGTSPWDASGNLKMANQDKSESAGISGSGSIDSYVRCRNRFNITLRTGNLTKALTPVPAAGSLAWLCDVKAWIGAGSADFELVEGDGADCATNQAVLVGDGTRRINLSRTELPVYVGGGGVNPERAAVAARAICAKSTNATDTNFITVVGTYALAP